MTTPDTRPRTGHTPLRVVGWIAAAVVVALPLLFGALTALGGALSEGVRAGAGDGPDRQSSTLASGSLTSADLTSLVRAALEGKGHAADGIDCPTAPGTSTEGTYECAGSVPGWQRVLVNVHRDRRFTVVGIDTEP